MTTGSVPGRQSTYFLSMTHLLVNKGDLNLMECLRAISFSGQVVKLTTRRTNCNFIDIKGNTKQAYITQPVNE